MKLVLMMGGQGSGKGTMSKKILSENSSFGYIETGALLRELPDTSPIKKIMERGEMVPDTDVFNLLKSKIEQYKSENKNVLLDGFPRKTSQAEWLVQNFGAAFDVVVVYLNLPESLMKQRIQNRIAMGGGRADDADASAVRRRLDIFFNETMPAINWLKSVPGVKFLEIPIADAPIEENYANVKGTLKNNKII